jgi:hypothetical protein
VYTVEPYPEAEEAIAALPQAASAGYRDAVEVIRLVPWNGRPYVSTKPDGSMRQLVFGQGGYGMVTYLVLEDEQRVDVLRVQWAR